MAALRPGSATNPGFAFEDMQARERAKQEAQKQGQLFLSSFGVACLLVIISIIMLLFVPNDTGVAILFSVLLVFSVAGMAWFGREMRRLGHFLKRDGESIF
jgi:hypothetical protein